MDPVATVESETRVDELAEPAGKRGWRPLFAGESPYAGGPDHYPAYLENEDGFEVELVAARHGVTQPG